ncbi:Helix-turn-helix of DDE superfamily endonuclease [Micromonospora matsumotoense]|uniref:Helix-turn-helix of DDE superfamily endonuclease n=1 Tax=Micromonospora matsumotoense TaxID=121616 RepID=A0A1C4YUH1_9ACTN|nr:transposase family protein [Micromonospora matsumotoense]SCF24395.1 Helix-turn-helix of DDE superfamily endonuclease [Micromonospora matsumotoense]
MLSYPATIPLSSRTLHHLADRIRAHRQQRRSRWRRLNPGRQALLVLAHLRNGDTYTHLAAGFEIGVATARRYVQEATTLISATAKDLNTAMRRIRLLAYAILDGTLIPIDRVADQEPYYSGKHRRHGVNVQVIADAAGRLVGASATLPGATHDLTAARAHGIIDALTSSNVMTFADKGYQGAHGSVRTPFERRRFRPKLSRRQKAVNRAHAKIRARGERTIATLKTWKILVKLRCCPRRATTTVQAILVLHRVEADRYAR